MLRHELLLRDKQCQIGEFQRCSEVHVVVHHQRQLTDEFSTPEISLRLYPMRRDLGNALLLSSSLSLITGTLPPQTALDEVVAPDKTSVNEN